jgi:hypothetical protein
MPKKSSPYPWQLQGLFDEIPEEIAAFKEMVDFDKSGKPHTGEYFKKKIAASEGVSHCVHVLAMKDSLSKFLCVSAVVQNSRGRSLV